MWYNVRSNAIARQRNCARGVVAPEAHQPYLNQEENDESI